MATRFSVEAVFKAVDRVTAPVNRMQSRVGKMTRSLNANFRRLNKTVDKFGRGIKRGAAIAATGLAATAAAMFNVLKSGAGFEQAITDVGAVGLQTRAQIKPLEDLALKLGRTTKFTATEAAAAMETMARAGFKNEQILAGVEGVLNAAAASGLEMAEVSNVVSNALKGMGLEATEASRVADVLALASARTNSSIGSLGESLKNVASTAKQLNVPFEDTVAAIALLQDVGLDASVAGSALNTMLTKMAKPPKAVAAQMEKMGISFKDAKGNMLPFQDVIQQVSEASKKAGGNFDRVAFLADLVGLRGQKAAANLADLFETGKLEKLTDELKNAEGAAKKMADLKMQTVVGQLTLLDSAVDGVKNKIFSMNEGPLKDTIKRMQEWVGANGDLIAQNVGGFIQSIVENIDDILRVGKQIAGITVLFVAFSAAVKVAAFASSLLNIASGVLTASLIAGKLALGAFGLIMKLLPLKMAASTAAMWLLNIALNANPIGLIVAGFALLIGIAALIVAAWDPVTQFFSDLFDSIGSVFDKLSAGAARFGSIFGFDDNGPEPDPNGPGAGTPGTLSADELSGFAPQVISPQERVTRAIEENNQNNTAEVTIKDDTGRAEVTKGKLGPSLVLLSSGND